MVGKPAIRFLYLGVGIFLCLGVFLSRFEQPSVQAQNDMCYFPETGHTLRGAFHYFWQTYGSESLFGYPITEEYWAEDTGLLTQYFERARFELVEQQGHMGVRLGNLGVEIVGERTFPPAAPTYDTLYQRYMPNTAAYSMRFAHYARYPYVLQGGFKEVWEAWGGEALFGMPISNEIQEPVMDGSVRTVQYFERMRFEYWPEMPPGSQIQFSHLGRLLAPPTRTARVPLEQVYGWPTYTQTVPPTPTPYIRPTYPPLAHDFNASVMPQSGPAGTDFQFVAYKFKDNETVTLWLTSPDWQVEKYDEVSADDEGSIAHEHVKIDTDDDFLAGVWTITARGEESEREAFAYFRITD